MRRLTHHERVVRDVSWHPFLPIIITSSWDGTHVAFDYQPKSAFPEESEEYDLTISRLGYVNIQVIDDISAIITLRQGRLTSYTYIQESVTKLANPETIIQF